MIYTFFSKFLYVCLICLCALTEPVLAVPLITTTLFGFGLLSAQFLWEHVVLTFLFVFFLGISTQVSWTFLVVCASIVAVLILSVKVKALRHTALIVFGIASLCATLISVLSPGGVQAMHWFFSFVTFCCMAAGIVWREQRVQRKKIHTWLSLNQ